MKNVHRKFSTNCTFLRSIPLSSSFERVVIIHCLATLDLGAGVEQQFDCLVVQNRQTTQSMGASIDGTLEDNMVTLWATLTGCRRVILHLWKQERKRATSVQRRLSRNHAVLGRAIPGEWMSMSMMKVRTLVVFLQPLRIQSVLRPERRTFVVRWNDELLCGGYNWGVSIWDAVHSHSMDRWVLSEADVKAQRAQRAGDSVAPLRRNSEDGVEEAVRWCRMQASSHSSQDVFDGAGSMRGLNTTPSGRSAVLCYWVDQG